MDQEVLVKELRDVVTRLEEKEGPVSLFLLALMEAGIDEVWNVIVSSPAFDEIPRRVAISKLSDYLRASLDKASWPSIGRTTILRTNDPFVEGVIRRFPHLRSGEIVQPLNVSGIEIPEAVILKAKKLAA